VQVVDVCTCGSHMNSLSVHSVQVADVVHQRELLAALAGGPLAAAADSLMPWELAEAAGTCWAYAMSRLARIIYIRCIYGIFGRESVKYT